MDTPEHEEPSVLEARQIIDCAWTELKRRPFVQVQLGIPPARLADVSCAEAERRSQVGHSILKRLRTLEQRQLPHDLALTLRTIEFQARAWSFAEEWYWIVLDPLGIGEFGLFLPTAYCGGFLLSFVHRQLNSFACAQPQNAEHYLELVGDYGRLIDQFAQRTAGQAQRGIRIPRVQVLRARSLLMALKSGARPLLTTVLNRQSPPWAANVRARVEDRIMKDIEPAFDRVLEGLSDRYLERASDAVGIGQYPGGESIYAELVRLHTTLELSPDRVQARGLERMTQIEESIRAIQAELGFECDTAGFQAYLNSDSRWRATTVEGVEAVFQRYIDRLRGRFDDLFWRAPRSGYGVTPLPEALEQSMTYGYYDPPSRLRGEGRYLFNAANLTRRPLFHLGSLTYHELMPGHHLQFALQQENRSLHPLRVHSFVTSYIEGWAEYAATLAGEIGLYETPEERYGRLLMDAFFTSRLVVDTGMNAFGWSLETARQWMRSHSRLTEAEILTESIRYSCDIPGQSLAYKLGDTHILMLRERMRSALGARFDIRDFHQTILESGALPLTDLEWHVEHTIQQRRAQVDGSGY